MSYSILERHRTVWKEKKIIREVYSQWYRDIVQDLVPSGRTLELGAGSGNFKEYKADVISSDIEECEWLDMCFDAHEMPFDDEAITNIVMIDVLHHLANPIRFLDEAYRVLSPRGRIVLVEPFPTVFSLLVYRSFHPEPFEFATDYFSMLGVQEKEPWESNQAIPYLLFFKSREAFAERFKNRFAILKRRRMSCILYPLSGGFDHRALVPDFLIPLLKSIEFLCIPLKPLMAFRCYVVLEKTPTSITRSNGI